MRIYLVRHGESLGNAARMYLGHTDLDLSERGREQAEMTAQALSEIEFDAIYSSDLLRAYNTALPHARLRGMEIITMQELREMAVGEWEMKPVDELEKTDAFINGWRLNFGTFTLPGGENVAAAADRVYKALLNIAEAHPGKCVLAVMHAAVIRAFWAKIHGFSPSEWASKTTFPTNASYSVVDYENGKFIPIEFSNDAHFKENDEKYTEA